MLKAHLDAGGSMEDEHYKELLILLEEYLSDTVTALSVNAEEAVSINEQRIKDIENLDKQSIANMKKEIDKAQKDELKELKNKFRDQQAEIDSHYNWFEKYVMGKNKSELRENKVHYEELVKETNEKYDNIKKSIDGKMAEINTVVEKQTGITKNAFERYWDDISTTSTKKSDEVAKTSENMMAGFEKGINDNSPKVQNSFTKFLENMKKSGDNKMGINSPSTVMAEMGKNISQGLQDGISSKQNDLANAMTNNINSIKNAVQNTLSAFKEMGSNMMNGLKEGISSVASSIAETARNVVDGAVNGVKSFLGIRSPSRLFRDEIGLMLGLGLAEGFEDSQRSIENAFEDTLFDSIDGISDLEDIGETWSESILRGLESAFSAIINSFENLVTNINNVLSGINPIVPTVNIPAMPASISRINTSGIVSPATINAIAERVSQTNYTSKSDTQEANFQVLQISAKLDAVILGIGQLIAAVKDNQNVNVNLDARTLARDIDSIQTRNNLIRGY